MTNSHPEASAYAESPEYFDTICRASAAAITAMLCANDTTADRIVSLLRAAGSLPADGRETPEEHDRVSEAALHRFGAMLTRLLEIAIHFAVDDDSEYLDGLRRFYLHPCANYSIDELAAIWRTSSEAVRDVFHDEVDEWADAHPDAADAIPIGWRQAVDAADAFGIVRAFDVERALGADFPRVREPNRRTVTLLLHIPQFITDGLFGDVERSLNHTRAARIVEQFILDSFAIDGIRGRRRRS